MSNQNKTDILTYSLGILTARWLFHLRGDQTMSYVVWSFIAMVGCGIVLSVMVYLLLSFYETAKSLASRRLR